MSSAIHYLSGQEVLGGNYHIHLIKHDDQSDSIKFGLRMIIVRFLWKEFNSNMPVSIEYNINFE